MCAGPPQVAFGNAYLSQGPSQVGGVFKCVVPEVIVEADDDDCEVINSGHVDAACVCCELVARMRTKSAADSDLEDVLAAVLKALTGKQQAPAEVSKLFEDRFKSAGGGQLKIEGPSPAAAMTSTQAIAKAKQDRTTGHTAQEAADAAPGTFKYPACTKENATTVRLPTVNGRHRLRTCPGDLQLPMCRPCGLLCCRIWTCIIILSWNLHACRTKLHVAH